jgi:chemotaxis protein MotB
VIQPAVTEAPQNPSMDEEGRTEALRAMADRLALEFDELINQGVVTVESNEAWLELSLRNSLLFSSGDAEPHYDAFEVVGTIASVLVDKDNAIRVEGFTDNQPIRTNAFPSNWELSTSRASAVVRMLTMEGVEPARMAAVGYGQHQPVARNDTEEGRRRNRRVVLLISRDASIRGVMR